MICTFESRDSYKDQLTSEQNACIYAILTKGPATRAVIVHMIKERHAQVR